MTNFTRPIRMQWDGEALRPTNGFWAGLANRLLTVGQFYDLVEYLERSGASHRHFFAAVHEGWQNLPEVWADRFPTSEHLRKYALIKAGYANKRELVASSKAEAERIAAFLRPANTYALVTVSESVVTEWTAESQSYRAMGKKRFQESKEAVLEVISVMCSLSIDELKANVGKAA